MNKVFVDSDVILDLLAHRIPHFHFAALLFTFADMKKIELYTSPTVLCNVFYNRFIGKNYRLRIKFRFFRL